MNVQNLKDNDQVTANIAPADAKGFAIPGATFDAPPVWTISDATVATITPSADGTSCVVASEGNPGSTANLAVSASVGGNPYQGTAQINIIPGDVAEVAISFGTPTAQPAATPAS